MALSVGSVVPFCNNILPRVAFGNISKDAIRDLFSFKSFKTIYESQAVLPCPEYPVMIEVSPSLILNLSSVKSKGKEIKVEVTDKPTYHF